MTEQAQLEPTRDDVPMPDVVVQLIHAKDAKGQPLRVQIQKLDAAELLIVMKRVPAEEPVPLDPRQRKAAEARVRELSPAAKRLKYAEVREGIEEVVEAAALEPVFYRGRTAPDPRPLAADGRQLAIAPFSILSAADRNQLLDAILTLALDGPLALQTPADQEANEAADRLTNFRRADEAGAGDGRGAGAAGEPAEPAPPDAGVPDSGGGAAAD